jgi:HEAT repeat protein
VPVTALLAALSDRSEAVRAEAARALGRLPGLAAEPRVVAALAGAIEDPREPVRWRAIEALVSLAPSFDRAWPCLRAALRSRDAYVRAGTVWYLHERADSARGATEELLPLLDDVEPGVRIVAVRALGALGASDPRTLARLQAILRDPSDGDARRAAARALARLGPAARGATPALVAALHDANGHVRREAAAALGRIRSDDADVIEALVAATRDEAAFVRVAAAIALGRLGSPPAARPALERLRRDDEEEVREAARRALAAGGAEQRPPQLANPGGVELP